MQMPKRWRTENLEKTSAFVHRRRRAKKTRPAARAKKDEGTSGGDLSLFLLPVVVVAASFPFFLLCSPVCLSGYCAQLCKHRFRSALQQDLRWDGGASRVIVFN